MCNLTHVYRKKHTYRHTLVPQIKFNYSKCIHSQWESTSRLLCGDGRAVAPVELSADTEKIHYWGLSSPNIAHYLWGSEAERERGCVMEEETTQRQMTDPDRSSRSHSPALLFLPSISTALSAARTHLVNGLAPDEQIWNLDPSSRIRSLMVGDIWKIMEIFARLCSFFTFI